MRISLRHIKRHRLRAEIMVKQNVKENFDPRTSSLLFKISPPAVRKPIQTKKHMYAAVSQTV